MTMLCEGIQSNTQSKPHELYTRISMRNYFTILYCISYADLARHEERVDDL